MCVCNRFYQLKVQTYNFIQNALATWLGRLNICILAFIFLSIYPYLASMLWSSQTLIPKDVSLTYLLQYH